MPLLSAVLNAAWDPQAAHRRRRNNNAPSLKCNARLPCNFVINQETHTSKGTLGLVQALSAPLLIGGDSNPNLTASCQCIPQLLTARRIPAACEALPYGQDAVNDDGIDAFLDLALGGDYVSLRTQCERRS